VQFNISEKMFNNLVNYRRDFHQYPEIGWAEYRTSAIVAEILKNLNFQVMVGEEVCTPDCRMGVPSPHVLELYEERAIEEGNSPFWISKMKGGQTGVVGIMKFPKPGPIIALRFDIDSLELNESQDDQHLPQQLGFRSLHDNLMHACGHDGHTAIGLGVAHFINKNEENLCGEVRLLFQPAEEGCKGAKSMVEAGWLEGVDYFYSGHIGFQCKRTGEIAGAVCGFLATSKINVTFKGIASHAGNHPEEGRNALLAAAAATVHLNGITRHGSGKTRINVGKLHGGTSRNIVADYAAIELETRGETSELNEYMKKEALRIIESVAVLYDVQYELEIAGEAPQVDSSRELIPFIYEEVKKMGLEKYFIPTISFNASEDVVYMIKRVQEQGGKASYLLFGSQLSAGHHQQNFNFDEQVLPICVELYSRLLTLCPTWDIQTTNQLTGGINNG
jgi:aminobenzoyl-glutamate utilization protein A